MAGLVVGLTALAVWGQERPGAIRPSEKVLTLKQALRLLTISQQTRFFFAFLFGGIFFLFIQQMALEPFGGDVFGLSVKETTLFNAHQMAGVLLGMGMTGGWLAKRLGKRTATGLGVAISAIGKAQHGVETKQAAQTRSRSDDTPPQKAWRLPFDRLRPALNRRSLHRPEQLLPF